MLFLLPFLFFLRNRIKKTEWWPERPQGTFSESFTSLSSCVILTSLCFTLTEAKMVLCQLPASSLARPRQTHERMKAAAGVKGGKVEKVSRLQAPRGRRT